MNNTWASLTWVTRLGYMALSHAQKTKAKGKFKKKIYQLKHFRRGIRLRYANGVWSLAWFESSNDDVLDG